MSFPVKSSSLMRISYIGRSFCVLDDFSVFTIEDQPGVSIDVKDTLESIAWAKRF